MARFTSVLFDLDGTLIDPGEGIAGTINSSSAAWASPLRSTVRSHGMLGHH